MKQLIAFLVIPLFVIGIKGANDPFPVKNLNGTWFKSVGEHEIEFSFKDSVLIITLKRGGEKLVLDCDIASSRDGRIFGTVSSVKESGIQGAGEKGDLFGFKVQRKGELVEISDLRGTNVNDAARNLVEGEFKKK